MASHTQGASATEGAACADEGEAGEGAGEL